MSVGNHWAYRSNDSTSPTGPTLVMERITAAAVVANQSGFDMQTYDASSATTATDGFAETSTGLITLPDQSDPIAAQIGSYELWRLPLSNGSAFQQLNKAGLNYGKDLDGDGINESFDVQSQVDVEGFWTYTTPAGTFANSAKIKTLTTLTVTLSKTGQKVVVTSTLVDWYAPDVGLVERDQSIASGPNSATASDVLLAYQVNGVRSDAAPPVVVATSPAAGATAIGIASVAATFSKQIDPQSATAAGFALKNSAGTAVAGTVSVSGNTVTFTSPSPLARDTYTATLGGPLADLAGNTLAAPVVFSFMVDSIGPSVVSSTPAPGATYVPASGPIVVEFSKPVSASSVNTYSVSVTDVKSNLVPLTYVVSGSRVTATPLAPLDRNGRYTLHVYDVTDLAGHMMQQDYYAAFQIDPGMFDYPKTVLSGYQIEAVAVGDVNGDGRPDIVAVTGYFSTPDPTKDVKVIVLASNGAGGFDPPAVYATQSSSQCQLWEVAIGDVNNDGRNDVVVTERGCGVEIFIQDAYGHLVSSGMVSDPLISRARLVDVNGDGRLDVVSFGGNTTTVVGVHLQGANGTFGAATNYAGPAENLAYGTFDVGDIDNDGLPDIVLFGASSLAGQQVAIFKQQPGGSFAAPVYHTAVSSATGAGVAIGDINGDGLNDILAAGSGNAPAYLGLLYQGSAGALLSPTPILSSDIPASVAIADMNNDGRNDLLVTHTGWGKVGYYQQDAGGTLKPEALFDSAFNTPSVQGVAAGDVNGDGYKDIVIAGQSSGLMVLYNRMPNVTAAAFTRAAPLTRALKATATKR